VLTEVTGKPSLSMARLIKMNLKNHLSCSWFDCIPPPCHGNLKLDDQAALLSFVGLNGDWFRAGGNVQLLVLLDLSLADQPGFVLVLMAVGISEKFNCRRIDHVRYQDKCHAGNCLGMIPQFDAQIPGDVSLGKPPLMDLEPGVFLRVQAVQLRLNRFASDNFDFRVPLGGTEGDEMIENPVKVLSKRFIEHFHRFNDLGVLQSLSVLLGGGVD
jgi:hypothetical protein